MAAYALVLLVHGLLIGLWLSSKNPVPEPPQAEPVHVVMLKPNFPKLRSTASPPPLFKQQVLNLPEPPMLAVAEGTMAPSGSGSGNGQGVDWQAEWRRALRAHEIRLQNPHYVSSNAAARGWWPETHRPGEPFKTADGDWIVWIDSSCYRVAGEAPKDLGVELPNARTYCIERSSP